MLPPSNALASDLSVELTAGGLTPEHVNYVSTVQTQRLISSPEPLVELIGWP